MLDIGWSELAVIVVVALIVIGPKDLPKVLKTVGIWIRKARMLTRDFQNSVDEMIREADMEDVRRQATELRNINIGREVEKTIDPSGSLRDAFDPNITARPRAEGAGAEDCDAIRDRESPSWLSWSTHSCQSTSVISAAYRPPNSGSNRLRSVRS